MKRNKQNDIISNTTIENSSEKGYQFYENVLKEGMLRNEEFDKKAIDASQEYLKEVSNVFSHERATLSKELERDLSDEQRQKILDREAEINREIIAAAKEHDENFVKPMQQDHKQHSLRLVASAFALVTGSAAIVYRKPLLAAGKQLLTTITKTS